MPRRFSSNTPRDRGIFLKYPAASRDSPLHYVITLFVKKLLGVSKLNLPWRSARLCSLVLFLAKKARRSVPASTGEEDPAWSRRSRRVPSREPGPARAPPAACGREGPAVRVLAALSVNGNDSLSETSLPATAGFNKGIKLC